MGVIMVLGIIGMCMPVVLPAVVIAQIADAIIYAVEGLANIIKF